MDQWLAGWGRGAGLNANGGPQGMRDLLYLGCDGVCRTVYLSTLLELCVMSES